MSGSATDNKVDAKKYIIHEGIVFAIELSKAVHAPDAAIGGRSQLFELLSTIAELFKLLVITLPHSGVSVFLYNCAGVHHHIHRLLGLRDINGWAMKHLNGILQNHLTGIQTLEERFPVSDEPTPLPKLFNTVYDEFVSKEYNWNKFFWVTSMKGDEYLDELYHTPELKNTIRRTIMDFNNRNIHLHPILLGDASRWNERDLGQYEELLFNLPSHSNPSDAPATDTQDHLYSPSLTFVAADEIKKRILRLKEVQRFQFLVDLYLSFPQLTAMLAQTSPENASTLAVVSLKGYAVFSQEKFDRSINMTYVDELNRFKEVQAAMIKVDDASSGVPQSEKTNGDGCFVTTYKLGDESFHLTEEQKLTVRALNDLIMAYDVSEAPEEVFDSAHLQRLPENVLVESHGEDKTFGPLSLTLRVKPPFLVVIGFAAMAAHPRHLSVAPPSFMTANVSWTANFSNSFKVYSSLYQACLKKKKCILVYGVTRKNTNPGLYVMYPTAKSATGLIDEKEHGAAPARQTHPEGFYLIRLAANDDYRSDPPYLLELVQDYYNQLGMASPDNLPEQNKDIPELVKSFTKLCKHFVLRDGYVPLDYPNPNINYFMDMLAQQLSQVEDTKLVHAAIDTTPSQTLLKHDVTLQTLQRVHESIHADNGAALALLKLINSRLNSVANDQELSFMSNSPMTAKKPATEGAVTDADMLYAWKNGNIHYYTMAQLKNYIKQNEATLGFGPTGTKQVLIGRLTEFLNLKNGMD
ncbi:hypothetical protein BABINDRAFT_163104 [Babjeviella inositovora NRRL Y-12698]|uniref:DNA helicase n=1 Tax=Babjeviella inositovora NRRL Y-12698 TaxID=984486 RepID=A0A1E3QK57_9ASCO|nr:uncharacterized protein BABINDRAFT_163104 [Babjeviella inositovora NRRL Y-12698]ODQ78079.1 hypothetical protein BABINDRAFT_163104 [Babjeviella inositovora NRRL Y-12698]